MNFCKKFCNWCCCVEPACGVSSLIDAWHGWDALGLSNLHCAACWWTLCAPICIDFTIGDVGKAFDHFIKSIKYQVLCCCLCCVSAFFLDGCYNCYMITNQACCQNKMITSFADLTKNATVLGDKIKQVLKIENGNEPLNTMSKFTP